MARNDQDIRREQARRQQAQARSTANGARRTANSAQRAQDAATRRTQSGTSRQTSRQAQSTQQARRAQQAQQAKQTQPANAKLIIGIVLAVIVVIAIALAVRGCSAPEPTEQPTDGSVAVPASVNRDALVALIGEEKADKLIARAAENEEALWIAEHPEAYESMGATDQAKILGLAADEELAVHFVRQYPDVYVAGEGGPVDNADESLAVQAKHSFDTGVPHFYQWDERWGYALYSSTAFAITGCCPTALAMVYQGLTGKTDMTPYDMALLAQEKGYVTAQNGTDGNFLVDAVGSVGLYGNEVYVDADEIIEHLTEGELMIANLGPGDFTDGGHYIVLAGLDGDGNVIVNDPFSIERSNKVWSPETIASQAHGLYEYRLA